MRLTGIGMAIITAAVITGCSTGPTVKQADYDSLPGSGDQMADGPGLLAIGQKDDYHGGYTVYSDNPRQKALINPHQQRQSTAMANDTTRTVAQPTPNQEHDYRQFQDFQQFKKFQQMPRNSPEYQQFRQWQEWKQYQQWKAGQKGNQ